MLRFIWCILLSLPTLAASAVEPLLVRQGGQDDPSRDGRKAESAFASVAYACERATPGSIIDVGPGQFEATRSAKLKSGVTIRGAGQDQTRIVAAKSWPLVDAKVAPKPDEEFLLIARNVKGVVVRELELASDPVHRISGAIALRDGVDVTLENLRIQEFRWAGLWLQLSKNLQVRNCEIFNASTQKDQYHSGSIRTRWLKESEFDRCNIRNTVGSEYGYKGGGHEKVRMHNTRIEVQGEFAFESAHENEYGLEIDHCEFNRCISVPKSGQGDDPAKRGCEYSVRIHHCLLTDSYTVEGPRNHLRFDHNHVRIEKVGGRVYSQHGGENRGPVWIEQNYVENLDRAFVWANRGTAGNVQVRRNTVFCADAGERTSAILDAYDGKRFTGWIAHDNIFVCPVTKPRELFPNRGTLAGSLDAKGNIVVHVRGVIPEGNQTLEQPPMRGGAKGAELFQAGIEPHKSAD
jgi:hypothetical protein